jgi:hypothetical protein
MCARPAAYAAAVRGHTLASSRTDSVDDDMRVCVHGPRTGRPAGAPPCISAVDGAR